MVKRVFAEVIMPYSHLQYWQRLAAVAIMVMCDASGRCEWQALAFSGEAIASNQLVSSYEQHMQHAEQFAAVLSGTYHWRGLHDDAVNSYSYARHGSRQSGLPCSLLQLCSLRKNFRRMK